MHSRRSEAGGRALIGIAMFVAGCGSPSSRAPDVVLVTLDTVRADRLGCMGSPSARTPVLDSWARGGALVRDCIADVPLTLPSHASIFTGRPSLVHGLRVNGEMRLSDDATTLAECLAERGYSTGAVVSSVVLSSRYGLAQGFASYDDSLTSPYVPQVESRFPADRHWLPEKDRRAHEAVAHAARWLGAQRGRRGPVFLWLHLYDAHFPYDPPAPWGRLGPSLYDAEIAALDRELVRLDRLVEQAERARPIVLAVVSDHGEGLGTHGEDEHGIFVYDETIRVPLVLRAPGSIPAGTILNAQVRTIDLAATIVDLAGEAERLGDGGSLLPAIEGRGEVPDSLAFSESIQSRLSYSGSGVKALRTRHVKVVECARPERFDLVRDPGEKGSLSPPDSSVDPLRTELRQRVAADLAKAPLAEELTPDATSDAALRSLGYVSSGRSAKMPRTIEDELRFDGFDPKDLVLVALAGRDLENGFVAGAEQKLARFFATADSPAVRPDMAPLWSLAHQNAAKAALSRHEFSRAAAEYELSLDAESSNPDAAWGIVLAWNLAGRFAEAERRGRELMGRRPGDEKLALHVALAAALAGRMKVALADLERLAGHARDAETRHVAELYAEKLSSGESERYLRLYLESS